MTILGLTMSIFRFRFCKISNSCFLLDFLLRHLGSFSTLGNSTWKDAHQKHNATVTSCVVLLNEIAWWVPTLIRRRPNVMGVLWTLKQCPEYPLSTHTTLNVHTTSSQRYGRWNDAVCCVTYGVPKLKMYLLNNNNDNIKITAL